MKYTKPRVVIPTGLGINSHEELKYCFETPGADVDFMLFNELIANPSLLDNYDGAGLAGGFAMGDHLGAGKSLANRVKHSGLKDKLQEKIDDPNFPMIIICNSMQLLAKLDMFPVPVGTGPNESGKHETVFWDLEVNKNNDTVWLNYLKDYDKPIFAPISHGEGRIYIPEDAMETVRSSNLVALRYVKGHICDFFKSSRGDRYNPNSSVDDIAGLGWNNNLVLFPHFERLNKNVQRPDRYQVNSKGVYMPTALIFKAAVDFMKERR